MIQIIDVSKVYNSKQGAALQKINLQIEQGEFVILIGESGAGKSTLLKLLTGQEKPTEGDVMIDGIDVKRLKNSKIHKLRRHIGVIFQDFKLLPTRTAYENVSLGLEVIDSKQSEIKKRVPALLEMVGLMDKTQNYPDELSGGEKQRVAIARALSQNPAILIADEPTGNLDKRNSFEIMQLLLEINKLGTTIILTTHNQDIVQRLNKRVVSLDGGRMVSDSASRED